MRVIARTAAAVLGLALALSSPAAALAADPPVATPGSGPVAVALVVPLSMPAGPSGLIDADSLEVSTSPAGALTRQLEELAAAPDVVIALDPLLLASIRVLGTSAPPSARDWLERLEALPNEVFLLAYANADLGALAAAEALDLAAPRGFDFALDPADFGPAVTAAPTESPTPSSEPTDAATDATDEPDPAEDPPLPTTDDLLAWPDALPGIAWPAEGSVTAAMVPALTAAGYTHVLAGSANLSETRTALATLDGGAALIADSPLSTIAREAATSPAEADRQDALARLGTALDGLAARDPGRTVVITLPRQWPLGVFRAADVAAAIDALPSSRLVPLSTVIAGPGTDATVVDPAPDEDHAGRIEALVAADRAEGTFSSILTEPLALTAPRRVELLALLSVSPPSTPSWEARTSAFLDDSREILSSVQVVEGSTLQVISSTTNLRIGVSNALPFAVTVLVDATPTRPFIRIDGPVEVTIEPESSTTATLPAQAITNGQVGVEVQLLSPATGAAIGSPRLLGVNLQAQWETVGIIVGIIVVIVFAAGIVRNIVVRSRAARRAAEGAEAADGDG